MSLVPFPPKLPFVQIEKETEMTIEVMIHKHYNCFHTGRNVAKAQRGCESWAISRAKAVNSTPFSFTAQKWVSENRDHFESLLSLSGFDIYTVESIQWIETHLSQTVKH